MGLDLFTPATLGGNSVRSAGRTVRVAKRFINIPVPAMRPSSETPGVGSRQEGVKADGCGYRTKPQSDAQSFSGSDNSLVRVLTRRNEFSIAETVLDAVIDTEAYEEHPEGDGDEIEAADTGNCKPEGPDETHEQGHKTSEDEPCGTQADHKGNGDEEEDTTVVNPIPLCTVSKLS